MAIGGTILNETSILQFMNATVYKSTGSWYIVKDENGQWHNARIKGIFKIDVITSTNPVAVGDTITIEVESATENTAIITAIHPRENYINRQSPRHKYQQHIVAANIQQSVLVITLKEPKTSQGFIDRFLVASEMYHVPPVLIFNKSDLYQQKEKALFSEWKQMYEAIGYPVFLISTQNNFLADEVKAIFAHKISLLSGHSGVGKSSLLNLLIPGIERTTKEVSGWSGKGQHTTTFAEMFDLPFGGAVIDTPGMREFGLVGVSRQELSHYFPEFKKVLNDCQFNNCLHVNEPNCAVKKAVVQGTIHEDRYISYCSILHSLEENKF